MQHEAADVVDWERWARQRLYWVALLLLLSVLIPVTALLITNDIRLDSPGGWFQRSGAAISVLAIFNQQIINGIDRQLQPKGLTTMAKAMAWTTVYPKLSTIEAVNVGVILVGTLIWGYGDLIF